VYSNLAGSVVSKDKKQADIMKNACGRARECRQANGKEGMRLDRRLIEMLAALSVHSNFFLLKMSARSKQQLPASA
jgi:hypothetical protein